jgi:hypothetical protein
MYIRIQCPKCEKRLIAPDELVGKKATCTQCSEQFIVPDASQTATSRKRPASRPLDDLEEIPDESTPRAESSRKAFDFDV